MFEFLRGMSTFYRLVFGFESGGTARRATLRMRLAQVRGRTDEKHMRVGGRWYVCACRIVGVLMIALGLYTMGTAIQMEKQIEKQEKEEAARGTSWWW